MAENGDNVLKVVELFVDNINEANKNVSKDLDRIDESLDELNKRTSTPPRHQELEADHNKNKLEKKLDAVVSGLVTMHDTIKSGMRTIKVVTGLFGIAILIAVSIVTYGNSGSEIAELRKEVRSLVKTMSAHIEWDEGKTIETEQLLKRLGEGK